MSERKELIARLTKAKKATNEMDVELEVALFKPNQIVVAVRPNSAGTKVIYTKADGSEMTCWAREWSLNPCEAIALLSAGDAP